LSILVLTKSYKAKNLASSSTPQRATCKAPYNINDPSHPIRERINKLLGDFDPAIWGPEAAPSSNPWQSQEDQADTHQHGQQPLQANPFGALPPLIFSAVSRLDQHSQGPSTPANPTNDLVTEKEHI